MLVIRKMRPSALMTFLEENSPSSIMGTPRDSWRKYLSSQGGTGQTNHDLESSSGVVPANLTDTSDSNVTSSLRAAKEALAIRIRPMGRKMIGL